MQHGMRPQDLYPGIGDLTRATQLSADNIAIARSSCETWWPEEIRVDPGSSWTATETQIAVVHDLAAAEDAMRTAAGRLEAAWSALGRLSSD